MIIKTYKPETLQEKETITQITSVIWNRRFYKNGSFEIQTTSDKFTENDIIVYKTNNEYRSGIIMKITENINGYSISGYDLKGIFDFRYITNPVTYSGTPEKIIKTMATEFLQTGDRTINGLIAESDSGEGEKITFTPNAGFLSKAFESLCLSNEIGISVEFDLQNIIFRTHKGVDRTDTIKFGRKFHNIDSIQYEKDLFNTYNVGYSSDDIGAETITGDAKGILRRECFQKTNIEDYLKEKAPIETIKGTATDNYIYGVDYKLGDYVTVAHKNLITKKQITEIKEVYERNNVMILPVFGTEKQNPIKKLLKGD